MASIGDHYRKEREKKMAQLEAMVMKVGVDGAKLARLNESIEAFNKAVTEVNETAYEVRSAMNDMQYAFVVGPDPDQPSADAGQ